MTSAFRTIAASVGKKLAVVAFGLAMSAVQTAHPNWPLPSADLTRDLVEAFLACHTLTDVVAIIKVGLVEYVTAKRAPTPTA